ncbi:alpha/beta fold hydrolase [Dyella choica]|nr:alpha/beta hydrolase [Dyella choica]
MALDSRQNSIGQPSREHRWRRLLARIGIGLLLLLVLTCITGATWNALMIRHYRLAYPAPGKTYRVDGHAMHMYCTGTGSPTLVLDAGLGDDCTVWAKVQPELSKTTQVCSYDRSGLGRSDTLSNDHDANTLADQLHALLEQAGIAKPFVLMGHSIAGVYLRAYATRYPHDLAGLVFVDGSTPDQMKRLPKEVMGSVPNFALMKWMTVLGVARATGQCPDIEPGLESERGWILSDACVPSIVAAGIGEFRDIDRSSDETRQSGPFGSLPILIFFRGPGRTRQKGRSSPLSAGRNESGFR